MTLHFWLGFSTGLLIGVMHWIVSRRSFEQYLMSKADKARRTPVCIRGQVFYLLPESEYVHDYLQLRRVADSFNKVESRYGRENRNPQGR